MLNKKLIMLAILIVGLLAVSAVSANENITEDVSIADNDNDDPKYSRNMSIALNISFSTENKFNIMVTLFHGFFYCFSFTVIIPTYTYYLDDFFENSKDGTDGKDYYGLLMMMAPIHTIWISQIRTFIKCILTVYRKACISQQSCGKK